MRKFLCCLAFGVTLVPGTGIAADYCGVIYGHHYGPLDYRQRGKVNLEIVEGAHFTPDVENGITGSTGYIGGDLNYTLVSIPNHARALATLGKLALKYKTVHVPNMKYPVECYFERAQRFVPDDPAPRAAYGNYLFALGRNEDALRMFKEALRFEPENPTYNYNLALLYLKKNDYEQANTFGQKAYALGFPLTGLRNKLKAAGKWHELPAPTPDAAAAPVPFPAPVPVSAASASASAPEK